MRAALLVLVLAGLAAGCGSADEDPPTPASEPAAADHAEQEVEYSGPDGPEHWGELHEEWATCGDGTEQSPVDVGGTTTPAEGALRFAYRPGPVSAADTGHSINFTPAVNDQLRVGGRNAGRLKQVHFHSPSEHRVDGRSYAMELHMVHATDAGATTVVGVLVDEGVANPALEPLSQTLPEGDESPVAGRLDPRDLLPADTASVRYRGSLTTPPCTEGVQWIVLTQPVTLSAAQLARFREHYDGNNRPLQPLRDRRLLAVR